MSEARKSALENAAPEAASSSSDLVDGDLVQSEVGGSNQLGVLNIEEQEQGRANVLGNISDISDDDLLAAVESSLIEYDDMQNTENSQSQHLTRRRSFDSAFLGDWDDLYHDQTEAFDRNDDLPAPNRAAQRSRLMEYDSATSGDDLTYDQDYQPTRSTTPEEFLDDVALEEIFNRPTSSQPGSRPISSAVPIRSAATENDQLATELLTSPADDLVTFTRSLTEPSSRGSTPVTQPRRRHFSDVNPIDMTESDSEGTDKTIDRVHNRPRRIYEELDEEDDEEDEDDDDIIAMTQVLENPPEKKSHNGFKHYECPICFDNPEMIAVIPCGMLYYAQSFKEFFQLTNFLTRAHVL